MSKLVQRAETHAATKQQEVFFENHGKTQFIRNVAFFVRFIS